MIKKLKQIGNSKGVILSKELLELLNIKTDFVEIEINNKILTLKAEEKQDDIVQSTCCECGEYTLCNQKTKLCLNCDKMFNRKGSEK